MKNDFVPLNIESALRALESGKYAFIDAGAGIGGSLDYCERTFAYGPGIGFDISARKVAKAVEAGLPVVHADVASTPFPDACVRFASLMDFLEHLPTQDLAEKILQNLSRAAREFVFIRHPNFDDIDYLAQFGLKLTWTDWSGHSNMMTVANFRECFSRFGWKDYVIIERKLIMDSFHPAIVPVSAPVDTHAYDPESQGPKDFISFEKPVYEQFDIFVKLDEKMDIGHWNELTSLPKA